MDNAQRVKNATTQAEEERLAKEYGIKGRTILLSLDSLLFPLSFPYNFMHLLYENVIKILFYCGQMLIRIWTLALVTTSLKQHCGMR